MHYDFMGLKFVTSKMPRQKKEIAKKGIDRVRFELEPVSKISLIYSC